MTTGAAMSTDDRIAINAASPRVILDSSGPNDVSGRLFSLLIDTALQGGD